jgi:bla regulator protein blaR1
MIDWLTGTFVATSLLMALVLVLREPVRRLFGPGVAYALWLLPAARAVLPSFTETVERVVPASASPMSTAVLQFSSAPMQPAASPIDWVVLALALWLTGAAVMLARGLFTYRAQRRGILEGAVQLARLDGIRILRSERIRGPLAFGIIDRVIVLPFDFDHKFTDRQRCLALEHELAHHRSGDLVANLFAYVLLCLQWFNPLAWAAHSAFRFDQEAACDARVLDKAQPGERASYGAAIAKAASGRTLLFSGALDRPSTLSRRLKIMTRFPSRRARALGFALVGGAVVVALPITATKAVNYVDKPSAETAPTAPVAPVARTAPNAPSAPLLLAAQAASPSPPAAPSPPAPPSRIAMFNVTNDDTVTINGVTKRWEDLTPQERARIRSDIAKARQDIKRQMDRLPHELAKAQREMAKFHNGEFQREMAEAREEIRRAMSEVDAERDQLRKAGVDPEKLKAEIQRSLAEVEKMDIDKIVREAMASVDMEKIRAEIEDAGESLDDIDERLDQLDDD